MMRGRAEFPIPDAVRLTGTVIGHLPVAWRALPLPRPSSRLPVGVLRIAIRENISGSIRGSETVVATLSYGASCESITPGTDYLEREYPIGAEIIVRGRATGSAEVPVISESNRLEYVVKIPADLPRTPYGDLDFSTNDIGRYGYVADYEFERAVLLLNQHRRETYERLLNLAAATAWRNFSDGRQRYIALIEAHRVNRSQRRALLARFDESRGAER
jgi:hypothetical protein